MKLKLLSLALILTLAAAHPTSLYAATFLYDEEVVRPREAIEDDVFAAGNTVRLDHAITGDVFAAGQVVAVAGEVSEDIFAAGNTVEIQGAVGDDVYVAGNTVRISSSRTDDIFAAGSEVNIGPDTAVAGDVYAAGATVIIDGQIAGNVKIEAEEVVIRSNATINGNLTTHGDSAPTIEEGVTIKGERKHLGPDSSASNLRSELMPWVRNVIAYFVAGLLALYFLPRFTRAIVASSQIAPARHVGRGLLWLVAFLPVSLLLAATIVGIPLMLLLIFFTALVILLAAMYANIVVGEYLMRRVFKVESALTWQHVLLGAVALAALRNVPFVGPLLSIIIILGVIGVILSTISHDTRGPKTPPKPALT